MTDSTDIDNIFAAASEPPEEKTQAFSAVMDTEGIDLFDHSAEEAEVNAEKKDDSIHIPAQPEHIDLPLNNRDLQEDPVGELRNRVERSFTGTFDVGSVVVEPDERSAFLRSALHDTEIIFDVRLTGVGVTIKIALPTETFTTDAASAATAWGESGYNDKHSNIQWLLTFQQMHAWFMVREINGVPTPWSDAFCDGVPKTSVTRAHLKEPANFEEFFVMTPVRWRMIVEAMRIAEFKYKLCMEAWQDRSFFTTAGTA
jgi:hypothetical protein